MSDNSSSTSNSSFDSVLPRCSNSAVGSSIKNALFITRICLLLPLCIFILYLGCQRWWRQRSFKTTSHSDIFTYHVAVVELIWVLGKVLTYCGSCFDLQLMVTVGNWLSHIIFGGEAAFHNLTCVERYVAVVHPIIYLGLRNARGVRIRNISIGCCWLLCFLWSLAMNLNHSEIPVIPFLCMLVSSLAIVSFCSLHVLCVLIRPGPGAEGGDRERVDQSKRRAVLTIKAITGVQWCALLGSLVPITLFEPRLLHDSVGCVLQASGYWCSLPSSLLLPLMYLQRAGKLSCCCSND